jgi:uncharacterized iron-regulated protein
VRKTFIFAGILLIISLFSSKSFAHTPNYHLDISFDLENHTLQGKASIGFHEGEGWQIYTGGLTIQDIILEEDGKEASSLPLPHGDTIHMYGGSKSQQLTINYSLTVPRHCGDNRISERGIVLTSGWYPMMQQKRLFSVDATLPPGFKGITESDNLPKQLQGNRMSSSFSQPVRAIHLAAGPYQITEETVREGLTLSTWFFAEDQELSREYLDAAKAFILRYEKEIGTFPYDHYAIVANRLPTGFGIPTYTLLGQRVLRLPFIKETSLGHEILHSWFGNSVQVSDNSGNWCEGLTSYLADFAYAEDKGKGAEHRKAALINYQSYVHADLAIELQNFRSASHNQPMAKAIRAVGYNRSAMLFHQLRGILGPENFYLGVRKLATSFKWKSASWRDIQIIFETVSEKDLSRFFDEQLARLDVPSIEISAVRVENKQDQSILHLTIKQTSEQPYLLNIPIRISTMAGGLQSTHQISDMETTITIPVSSSPLSVVIDPDYDLFRTLNPSEFPPVWSRFSGAEQKLLILGEDNSTDTLAPFIQWAEKQGWTVLNDEEVTNKQLSEHSILFLGSDSDSYRSLFGKSVLPQEGFSMVVQNNPLNTKEVSVLLTSESSQETASARYKLKHYGKYSSLAFKQGKVLEKHITATDKGIEYTLESLPLGGATSSIKSFEQIITELADKQVIYIGETHDSFSDHLLQLRILQALQKKGVDLAIGMEMFPASSQKALDEYLLEETEMDEEEFLRASRYFDVWRYDWRLFRPIFNFCRQFNIPVYGININREIVSTVFAKGSTDTLSDEQLQTIAKERDLAIDGYVERLRTVHTFHAEAPHGKGKGKGIAGFIQSQAIWDESMAANIAEILDSNPEKTVVVIAGSQHTRKDSGIPPRLLRRMNVSQASVLNIYGSNPLEDPGSQADYFFLAEPLFLEAKGKIGIILGPEKDEDGDEHLKITGLSHAGKAKESGIQEGDIISSINDQAVKNMEDIGIIMMDSRAGDILTMKVLRKDASGEAVEKELSVELSDLSKPAEHP